MMGGGETAFFTALLGSGFVCAVGVFVALCFVNAPYGRYQRPGWGPEMKSVYGWVLMEIPAVVVFGGFFLWGQDCRFNAAWVLVILWELHYVHRTFVFPFRLRERGKTIPVLIVFFGMAFNTVNGYLNGRGLGVSAGAYGWEWMSDPRFVCGALLFLASFALNLHSDRILLRLRGKGETGYKIPYGGLFRWVSCPNYLTELLQWAGWALAVWSLAGLFFAVWTAANLFPRAWAYHRWYQREFTDYPKKRRAIIPYLW